MDTNNKPVTNEEIVIKRQWMALIAAFVLFFLAGFISLKMTGVVKYGVIGACIPMLYIGGSSIKNRISIARLRGQKGYSRDRRAVVLGSIMLIIAITYLVIVFIPFLLQT
jgi:hypothetical protein